MLISQKKNFLRKSAIYHSFKLPLDAEVTDQILNVIYSTGPKIFWAGPTLLNRPTIVLHIVPKALN